MYHPVYVYVWLKQMASAWQKAEQPAKERASERQVVVPNLKSLRLQKNMLPTLPQITEWIFAHIHIRIYNSSGYIRGSLKHNIFWYCKHLIYYILREREQMIFEWRTEYFDQDQADYRNLYNNL